MPRQHCTNFPDITQENSRANFEQKDKIAGNIQNFFVTAILHQNKSFDNLRTQELEREKSQMEGTDGKRYKKISRISYQLPVMFSMFSLNSVI